MTVDAASLIDIIFNKSKMTKDSRLATGNWRLITSLSP
jgi:hypothetical protein